MNIQIPQPTVLERLEKDLEDEKEALKKMEPFPSLENVAAKNLQTGYMAGLEYAIEVIKLNQD